MAEARLDRQWHEKNRMPKNPSLQERIKWHVGHANNCSCRPMPEKLAAEIKKSKTCCVA